MPILQNGIQLSSKPTELFTTLQIGMEYGTTGTGGVDRVFSELAHFLPAQGIGFCGIVTGPSTLARDTAGLFRSAAPSDAGTLSRLRGLRQTALSAWRECGAGLLASHFAFYTLPVADQLRHWPHVVHFHGPWAAESLQEKENALAVRLKQTLERRIYATADRVIVLSQAFARVAVETYRVPEAKVRIVPGSVDLGRFLHVPSRAQARDQLRWPTDRPILLTVRRLTARMGLNHLLQAMQTIIRRHPDALLKIGGQGPLRDHLQSMAASLGIANHVEFLGFVRDEELPLVYAAADYNVVPTLAWEGFGLVAAEALAAGTPSLVTPVGGLPEVVNALSSNLIFPSTDPDDLAETCMSVLSGTLALPDRLACQAYAAQAFSSEQMAARTAAVYREVVS